MPEDNVKSVTMSASSYVILGLVDALGSATPYDLKQVIGRSIGYFWDFPQSQLYAEAARLEGLGLIERDPEAQGRRRRVLSLTPAGRRELERWVAEPTDEPTEIRDLGLLKLFFAGVVDRERVVALAGRQLDAHRRRLSEYEELARTLPDPAGSAPLKTLEMGLRFERLSIAFWGSVLDDPPSGPPG
jgi:DNA-binding PadR family transcriptional regulator